MATFYDNAVSRALRCEQRVDVNYNIPSAVRAGDSRAEARGHRLWITGVSLVGPSPESESPPWAGRGDLSPRIRWFSPPVV